MNRFNLVLLSLLVPSGLMAANGYGGNGGIDICTIKPAIVEIVICQSPIEQGYRVPVLAPSDLNVDVDTVEFEIPSEATPYAMSLGVSNQLKSMSDSIGDTQGLIWSLATNNNQPSTILYLPTENPGSSLPAWSEYQILLGGDPAFLFPIHKEFEESLFGYGFVVSAVSNDSMTYLFKYFAYLNSQQKAMRLVHEGLIRSCRRAGGSYCLYETLLTEGMLYDHLQGKSINLELLRKRLK